MTKHKLIKSTTTHYVYLKSRQDTVYIAVNDDADNMSIYDGVEPCSGVLRHWGTREELKRELLELVDIIDEM